jgi:hypothetical protein
MQQWFEDQLQIAKEKPGGAAESELTISSGSVTPDGAHHTLDTESDAASDDLNNAALTNHPEGRLLWLRAQNGTRTVVIKHAAGGNGQFLLRNSSDFSLDDTEKRILFQRVGTDWVEVQRILSISLTPDANGVLMLEDY